METFYREPAWLETVRQQERTLVFKRFTREDALKLGLTITGLIQERYHGNAAICILEDGMAVFSYKMPGTGLENEWWMRRKLNVSRRTGLSSMLAGLEAEYGDPPQDLGLDGDRRQEFAACGGCFPIRMRSGETAGYLLVSGLEHYEDHQVIVDAVSSHLNVKVNPVCVSVTA